MQQGIAQEKQCIEYNPILTGSFWEKKAKNQKSAKKRQIYPFWGCVPDPPRLPRA